IGHVHVKDLDLDLVVHLHVVVDIADVLVRDLRNMNQPCPRSLDLYECPEVRYPADRPLDYRSRRYCHLTRRPSYCHKLLHQFSILPITPPPSCLLTDCLALGAAAGLADPTTAAAAESLGLTMT